MASSYLEVLVGCLLVFPVHGARGGAGEEAHRTEDGEAGQEADHCVEENLASLTRGIQGTGTVRTEGDPVGYLER